MIIPVFNPKKWYEDKLKKGASQCQRAQTPDNPENGTAEMLPEYIIIGENKNNREGLEG